jgi:hypothetical protein
MFSLVSQLVSVNLFSLIRVLIPANFSCLLVLRLAMHNHRNFRCMLYQRVFAHLGVEFLSSSQLQKNLETDSAHCEPVVSYIHLITVIMFGF